MRVCLSQVNAMWYVITAIQHCHDRLADSTSAAKSIGRNEPTPTLRRQQSRLSPLIFVHHLVAGCVVRRLLVLIQGGA